MDLPGSNPIFLTYKHSRDLLFLLVLLELSQPHLVGFMGSVLDGFEGRPYKPTHQVQLLDCPLIFSERKILMQLFYYHIIRVHIDSTDDITYCNKIYTIETQLPIERVGIYFPKPDWIVKQIPSPVMPIVEAIRDAKSKGWLK